MSRLDAYKAVFDSPLRLQILVHLERLGSAEANELAKLIDDEFFGPEVRRRQAEPEKHARRKKQSVRHHLRPLAAVGAVERVRSRRYRGFDAVVWTVARRGWIDLERQLGALGLFSDTAAATAEESVELDDGSASRSS